MANYALKMGWSYDVAYYDFYTCTDELAYGCVYEVSGTSAQTVDTDYVTGGGMCDPF